MIVVYIYIPVKYYLIERGLVNIFKVIFIKIDKIFKEISIPDNLALSFLCVVIFIYLVVRNFLGLFPFIFTRTAHPFITLGFGLIL